MVQLNERSLFSGLLFLFAGLLLYKTIGMKYEVALVPRIVGFSMLGLTAVQLLNDLFAAIQKRLPSLNQIVNEDNVGGSDEASPEEIKKKNKSTYLMIAWMIVFLLLIYFTSMIWALIVSMFIYLRWINKESWKMSILYPVITAIVSYLVFVVGFDLYFFF